MTIDTSFMIAKAIDAFVTFLIFLICFLIYKNTKGASIAYKIWGKAVFIVFFATVVSIISGIAFGCNDTDPNLKNEIHTVVVHTIKAFGYFYIPIGIMYFSKDLGFVEIDKNIIQKIKIGFFSIVSFIFTLLIVLIPITNVIPLSNAIFNSLYVTLWCYMIYYYIPVYKHLKSTNICWLLIFIGIFGGLVSDLSVLVTLLVPEIKALVDIGQLVMAVGFIFGFFKLGKMVEAI